MIFLQKNRGRSSNFPLTSGNKSVIFFHYRGERDDIFNFAERKLMGETQIPIGTVIAVIGAVVVFFSGIVWAFSQKRSQYQDSRIGDCEESVKEIKEHYFELNRDMKVVRERTETMQEDIGEIKVQVNELIKRR